MSKKFWDWKVRAIRVTNEAGEETITQERTLFLDGPIADESWFGDEITPAIFREELNSGTGDITVWINSPGGDCFAAAQIFNMIKEYPGNVTVKIDSIAASAASVIAMAGDTVLMSPVGLMMIHDPSTIAAGNVADMEAAIQVLEEVKESIINAYMFKTNLTRKEISKLMSTEFWMNANEAMDKGFVDGILYADDADKQTEQERQLEKAMAMTYANGYSPAIMQNRVSQKILAKLRIDEPKKEPDQTATISAKVDPNALTVSAADVPTVTAVAPAVDNVPANTNNKPAPIPVEPEPSVDEGGTNVAELYERLNAIKENFKKG